MSLPPASSPSELATLGEFGFSLGPQELRERARIAIDRAGASLAGLLDSSGPRTVAGFLEPLDRILSSIRDVSAHGSLLFAVHPDLEARRAGREVSEAADRFFHAFRLNSAVYAALGSLDLTGEDHATRFAVEKLRRDMRRAGVERSGAEREELLRLNEAIDTVANRFSENLANLERSIELESPARLTGLPADFLASHRPDGGGRVRITTRYPDFRPVMAYAEDAEVRRRLALEFANRAYPENEEVLTELLARRHRFARLLGHGDYSEFSTEDKMLEAPEKVEALLERLANLLRGPANAELERLVERKRQDQPGATRIEPWEGAFFGPGYYDEKVRRERFGVDLRALRAYLPYRAIRDGLFSLCHRLLGIEFLPSSASAWHPSVEVYDVRQNGRPLGRAYLDLVPRDGKYGHAACFTVREGRLGGALPQAALVCNFLAPGAPVEQARMEYSDLVTFFHEFGHLLHGLLGGHQRWFYNSPSNLEWDFIEAPSLLFEEWARDPATLGQIAVDPDSGQPAPPELLARLRAANAFGRPLGWLRQVALASTSLALYRADPAGLNVSEVARLAHNRYSPIQMPSEYHFADSFGHLTAYAACYYTYAWSAVIARDLLEPFREQGTLTSPEVAERYAREILTPGSQRPASELIRAYLGREVRFDAFERWVTEAPVVPPG